MPADRRQSVVFRDPAQLAQCLRAVGADPDAVLLRVKNRLDPAFDSALSAGQVSRRPPRSFLISEAVRAQEARPNLTGPARPSLTCPARPNLTGLARPNLTGPARASCTPPHVFAEFTFRSRMRGALESEPEGTDRPGPALGPAATAESAAPHESNACLHLQRCTA